MVKHKLKRVTALLLACVLAAGLAVTGAVAASSTDVTYEVEYKQDLARESIDYVNAFRTSDTWYWNSDNTTKTEVSGLNALEYDYTLETISMQRAAEIAIYFSHTRPNGEKWSTAVTEAGYTYRAAGENLAAGTEKYCGTAEATIELLKEDNYNYSGQGHRRVMLNSNYTAYAMGCVYLNGAYYWAMTLTRPSGSIDTVVTTPETGSVVVSVSADSSMLNFGSTSIHDVTLDVNNTSDHTYTIPDINDVYITPSYAPSKSATVPVNISSKNAVWTSSDENVATVSDHTITAVGNGTATISTTINDMYLSFTVTVVNFADEYDVVHVEQDPGTCISHGHDEYWYVEQTRKYYKDEHLQEETTLDELTYTTYGDHDFSDLSLAYTQWTTCEDEGYIFHVCKYCGEEIVSQTLEPEGHSYVGINWGYLPDDSGIDFGEEYQRTLLSIEPTCTEDGMRIYQCVRGDIVYWPTDENGVPIRSFDDDGDPIGTKAYDCDNVIQVTIPATGHSWSEWTNNGDGTATRECLNGCGTAETVNIIDNCDHSALETTFIWSRSENSDDEDIHANSETLNNNEETEPGIQLFSTSTHDDNDSEYDDDDWSPYLEELNYYIDYAKQLKKSDYTEDSWSALQSTLTNAENIANDKNATDEEIMEATSDLISAINNLQSIWSVRTDAGTYSCKVEIYCPTCGLTEYHPCEVFSNNDSSATCSDSGTMSLTAVYNDMISDPYEINVPATGNHTWGEEEITAEPTCLSSGIKTYTCSACGTTKEEPFTIEDVSHVFEPVLDSDGNIKFDWSFEGIDSISCSMEAKCSICGLENEISCSIETIDIIGVENCEEEEIISYIATSELNGQEYTSDETSFILAPAGTHHWSTGELIGEPTKETIDDVTYYVYAYEYTCDICGYTMDAEQYVEIDPNDEEPTEPVVDKTVLETYIDNANDLVNNLNPSDYTDESWEALEYALEQAISVCNDPSASQDDVDIAQEALWDAIAGLHKEDDETPVDKTELGALIDKANSLRESNYTSDSWSVLETALNDAEAVFKDDNSTQLQVNYAASMLKTAIDSLVETNTNPSVNKEKLYDIIAYANALKESDYTSDSWSEFKSILASAVETYNNENATQDEVDSAVASLSNAISSLVEVKQSEEHVNKEELGVIIDYVNTLAEDHYTTESWEVLRDALELAISVYNDNNSSQEDVDDSIIALTNAITQLVPISHDPDLADNKIDLENCIEEAEYIIAYIDTFNYTEDSLIEFYSALAYAQDVYSNPAADDAEIAEAISLLQAAIESLEYCDHDWSVSFNWDNDYTECTATFVCDKCGKSKTVDCTITESTTDPTCGENGSIVYTASVEFNGMEYTSDETVTIPATGEHTWTHAFEWNENDPECTITFTCSVCGEQYGPYACDVTRDESNDDTENGLAAYTATFTDKNGTTYKSTHSYSASDSTTHDDSDKEELTDELEEDIKKAEALNENDYTEDSWEALEEALAHAKAVLADENATEEELSEAIEELETAMKELETVSAEDTTSNSGNNGSSNTGTGTNTSSSSGSGDTVDYGGKTTDSDIKTGDIIMYSAIGVVVIAAIVFGVVMLTRRGKKEENTEKND